MKNWMIPIAFFNITHMWPRGESSTEIEITLHYHLYHQRQSSVKLRAYCTKGKICVGRNVTRILENSPNQFLRLGKRGAYATFDALTNRILWHISCWSSSTVALLLKPLLKQRWWSDRLKCTARTRNFVNSFRREEIELIIWKYHRYFEKRSENSSDFMFTKNSKFTIGGPINIWKTCDHQYQCWSYKFSI